MPEEFITDIVDRIRDSEKTIRKGLPTNVRIRRFGSPPPTEGQPRQPFEPFQGRTPEQATLDFRRLERQPRDSGAVFQPFQQQPRLRQARGFGVPVAPPEREPPFRGVISEPDLPFEQYQKLNKALVETANVPLFSVGGVNISAPDIVAVGLIAYMGAKGVQALVGVGKEVVDKSVQFAMNKGVDEFIRKLGRGAPPSGKLGGVYSRLPQDLQVKIAQYLQRNPGLVERATNNYQQRIGRGIPGGRAAQETSTEMMRDIVKNEQSLAKFTPGGTAVLGQTRSLADIMAGARAELRPEGIPMPPEARTEAIIRANALLETNPIPPNTLKSIGTPVGEVLVRTDAEGQTLVVAQILPREGQMTASNIVLAEGKGLAGGRAVKEVIDYLQKNNIALPPREEMSPEALRLVDKTVGVTPQPTPEPLRTVPEGVTPPVEPLATPQAQTQQVASIQEQGKTAPESVPPEDAKMAHTEMAAPDGPKPPRPPDAPVAQREPDDILGEIASKAGRGERPDQTLLRLHQAAIEGAIRRSGIKVQEGSDKLKKSGIGIIRRGQLVPRPKDIAKLDEQRNLLHNPSKVASGELKIPAGFEEMYRELRALTDWEQAARLDFDPNMATVNDYFDRGWKPPEGAFTETVQGRPLVRTPKFKKPRVNATYQEMRDAGFEPLFWNHYQQWAASRIQGTKYREQMKLVEYLKGMGEDLIKPHDGGPIPQGWRVPEVGPAFEGKPFAISDPATGEPAVMFSRRWIVRNEVANTLENIYGKRPDLGKFVIKGKTIDPLTLIDFVTFVPKRAKLFLSFFQQVDFLTRAGGSSWSMVVDSLLAGKPIKAVAALAKYPVSVVEILHANFSPAKRLSLAKQLDDTTPLVQGRPGVTLKGISEAGLSTFDPTILPADMDKIAHQIADEAGALGLGKQVVQAILDAESAMRRGLFQGTYPAALITSIKNNIAPMMVRQWGSLNDAQINAEIARQANKLYSTIPASQSVIQNRALRETLRRLFFSIGESEGLLRQATSAFKGPNAAYWRKHYIGVYLFLITVANIIHFATTGEPLPADRYSPIAKDNWGPLPFGYNRDFAAPTIPIKGRGGVELTLDLAGQMDTAFRILNPVNFITSRESVPVRATVNQISGTDFYGAPIDDVGPGGVVSRISQLMFDLLAPIGVGGIGVDLTREAVGEAAPEIEERLGVSGLALQATGINIRAETTRQLLDRFAQESGLRKADGSSVEIWADLEPYQKIEVSNNEQLQTELGLRSKAAAERQQLKAAGFATLDDIDKQRIVRGEALVTEYFDELVTPQQFRSEVTLLKREMSARKAQVDEDFQLFKDTGEMPTDPKKKALTEYYNTFDKAKRASGVIDWDKQERLENALRLHWTGSQEAYVDRNIGLTEWGPLMDDYNKAVKLLQPYWEVSTGTLQPSKRRQMRRDRPEIDVALVKWYGYKPITSAIPVQPRRLKIPTTSREPGTPVRIKRF